MGTVEEPEESESLSPRSIRYSIEEKVGYLLDNNAQMMVILRQKAIDFRKIGDIFMDQAVIANEIADEITELTLASVRSAGDIIIAELDEITIMESDDSEDE